MNTPLEKTGSKPSERLCENWLEEYLNYTSNQESPEQFHTWCALSIIAAAISRRNPLKSDYFEMFPNLYVVLVGASARVRKSSAIMIAQRLFRKALPSYPLITVRVTPEALISTMFSAQREHGAALCYLVADEFHTLVGRSKHYQLLISTLTSFYDCKVEDGALTQLRGLESLNNLCVNILAASTPHWLRLALPPDVIGGGFTSRIIFVYAETTDRCFPELILPEGHDVLEQKLIEDLQTIANLNGHFDLHPSAKEWYYTWYRGFDTPDTCSDLLVGYYGRRSTHLRKVAALLSASRSNEMIISLQDIQIADKLLEAQEHWLPKMIALLQTNVIGEANTMVLNMIGRGGKLDYSSLLRRVSYRLGAQELMIVLDTLRQARQIEEVEINGTVFYVPYGAGKK